MLIRSGKLVEDTLVLTRKRSTAAGTRVVAEPTPEAQDRIAEYESPVTEMVEMAAPSMSSEEPRDALHEAAGAGVAAAAISYAEYKERFQRELEDLREQAVREGYREGEQLVRQELEEEFGKRLKSLIEVIEAVRRSWDAQLEATHEIGAEIVYETVLKILGDVLVTREGVQAVVREVIGRVRDATTLRVRVSPADFEWLDEQRSVLFAGLPASKVELVADERVELGGCLLETPSGNLDGRLEVQLQCFRDALLNARLRRSEGGAS